MTHPLDLPVWHALRTRQSAFAIGDEYALRFMHDVGPFAAARDNSGQSMAALGKLVSADGGVVQLQADESPLPPGTAIELTALGAQMVLDKLVPPAASARIEQLNEVDAPEMLALATLTKPGPFLARSHLLGKFWGVKENGVLIAMAGERMKLEGFTEVSGVCTHPDFRGRGYAAILSHTVATQILKAGDIPFLHAFATNTAAINVYAGLGFKLRRHVTVTVLRRAGS